jgi:hypothetical protein
LPAERRASLGEAVAALDRFADTHADIITLSRLNTNVRSLALTLGRKRTLTLACDDALAALEKALAKYQFTGTR